MGIKKEREHNWGGIVILSGKPVLPGHPDHLIHFAAPLISGRTQQREKMSLEGQSRWIWGKRRLPHQQR